MGKEKKLKRKIAILKQRKEKSEEMKKLEIELAGLKREEKTRVWGIKHKRKIAIVKTAGVIGARVGRGLGVMAKGVLKKARESKGLKRSVEQMYSRRR